MTEQTPPDVELDTYAINDSEKAEVTAKEVESIEQGEIYYSKTSVWLMLIFMSVATGSDS